MQDRIRAPYIPEEVLQLVRLEVVVDNGTPLGVSGKDSPSAKRNEKES